MLRVPVAASFQRRRMTKLQRHLIVFWCIELLLFVALVVAFPSKTKLLFTAAIFTPMFWWEQNLIRQVYAVAPTPRQLISEHPAWKSAFLIYGALLIIYAVVLLFLGGKATELFLAYPLQMFAPVVLPALAPYVYSQLLAYRKFADYEGPGT